MRLCAVFLIHIWTCKIYILGDIHTPSRIGASLCNLLSNSYFHSLLSRVTYAPVAVYSIIKVI
jgi:hypothetical protein